MENFASYYRRRAKSAKSTKRGQFIQYWQSLADVPMMMEPIKKDHKGSTKAEDGIRITGNPHFIAAVLSRLKDILLFENPQSRIEIIYDRGQGKKSGEQSYICYINIRER